jgi:hypothetical protein
MTCRSKTKESVVMCNVKSVRDSGRHSVHNKLTLASPLHDHTARHIDENLMGEIYTCRGCLVTHGIYEILRVTTSSVSG